MDAQALCARVRVDLGDVEDRIRGNSWLADVAAGRLSTAALRAFVGEQLQIIPSDLRSFQMLARAARLLQAYELLFWNSLPR